MRPGSDYFESVTTIKMRHLHFAREMAMTHRQTFAQKIEKFPRSTPDAAVAKKLGCTTQYVKNVRLHGGLDGIRKYNREASRLRREGRKERSVWTQEETRKLVRLWSAGKSQSDIGVEINRSSSSVAGKLSRLNLR